MHINSLINSFIHFPPYFTVLGTKTGRLKKKKGCFHLEIIAATSININTLAKKGLGVRMLTVTLINDSFPIDYTTNKCLRMINTVVQD